MKDNIAYFQLKLLHCDVGRIVEESKLMLCIKIFQNQATSFLLYSASKCDANNKFYYLQFTSASGRNVT